MNLNGWRPGQQLRPRLQTIAQRTTAVAPHKKSWRSQAHFFRQLDRPSATRTKRSTQSTEEKLKTSIAASPSLSRALRSRASSAYSREAESDRFLACAAKRNRGCRRRARDDSRRRSHLLSSVLVSRVLCEMLLFFRTHKISRTRGFPIEPKAVFSHQIESNSSRLIRKRRFESIRFEELSPLIRALSFCFFSISAEFFFFSNVCAEIYFFNSQLFCFPPMHTVDDSYKHPIHQREFLATATSSTILLLSNTLYFEVS